MSDASNIIFSKILSMSKKNKPDSNAKADYNRIATEFSTTRVHSWPEIEIFNTYIKDSWSVLDLGCGNGRLIEAINKKIDYTGIDSSGELIKIAHSKHPKEKFEIMKMEDLKLKDESFDAVFTIASLHHLPTKELRVKALTEANRVLKNDGYFFITVWNLWQPKYRKYIWKNLSNMMFKSSGTHFGDTFIPWKDSQRNVLAERYYFAYPLNGLRNDLKSSGFNIVEIRKSKWNIYAICKK